MWKAKTENYCIFFKKIIFTLLVEGVDRLATVTKWKLKYSSLVPDVQNIKLLCNIEHVFLINDTHRKECFKDA